MPKMQRNVLRIDPAERGPVLFAIYSTALIVVVSFVLSYAALSTLSVWMALPVYLGPLLPIFIDGAIIVYTYAAIAARAEGEPTWRPWMWVGLWTTVSAGSNAAHAWLYGPQGYEGIVGSILAGLIPIGSLLGTHEIAHRIIVRPGRDIDVALDTVIVKRPGARPVSNPSRVSKRRPSKVVTVSTAPSVNVSTDGVKVDSGPIPQILDTLDTEARDLQIVQWANDKVSKVDIAKRAGLSRQQVYNILDKAQEKGMYTPTPS